MEGFTNNFATNSDENELSELDVIRKEIEEIKNTIGRLETYKNHADNMNFVDDDDDDDDDDDHKFASTVKSFFESSTLHGFHNLMGTVIWVRVLWILAMTGVISIFTLQVIGLAQEYLSYHVTTDVTINLDKKTFPAITVCNNRRFISWKVAALPIFAEYQNVSWENRTAWESLLRDNYKNLTLDDFDFLGADVRDTIVAVDDITEGLGVMIEPVPYHGSCYTVKPPANTTVLTILFDLLKDESIDFEDRDEGFTVYLKPDPSAYPHQLYEPVHFINVPPRHMAVNEISYDIFERLNGSYSQCQDNENLFYDRVGIVYEEQACIFECLFKTILSTCRCIRNTPELYPFWMKEMSKTKELRNCLDDDIYCIDYVEKTFKGQCQCKPECHEVIYRDDFRALQYVNCKFNPYLEMCDSEKLRRQWSNAEIGSSRILLSPSPYKTYKQSPSYPLLRFMSDIGGTMGLYLGASILTTFEFVQMAIACILHVVKKILP